MPRYSIFLVMALLVLGGCSQRQPSPVLHTQLGGQTGIAAVVENLMFRVADDPELVGFFAHTNIDHFVASLEEKLCELSGGPCIYSGPSMERAHQHMGLDNAHFNRLVEHLEAAMVEEEVPLASRNRLFAQLAPLHAGVMRLQ